MLATLTFLLIFIVGFIFASSLFFKLPLLQKIGLGFPLGFGLFSVEMIVLNLFNIKFSILLLSIIAIIISIVLVFLVIKPKVFLDSFKIPTNSFSEIKIINISWLLMFSALAYILYGIISKTLFWPPCAYDTVTGYDYMAKVIAGEGCFDNSIFSIENSTSSIRHSYPPFVSAAYSIPYFLGLNSSKISLVLIFSSFVFVFWNILRKYTNQTLAIFFTLLLFSTPEFIAMSALSLTNVPQTIFATTGLIYLNEYLIKKEKGLLYLSAVLLAFNVWTRLDGMVFAFGGGFMLIFQLIKDKSYRTIKSYFPLLFYTIIVLAPIVLWESFKTLRINDIYESSKAFRTDIFFDSSKISELRKLIWSILKNTQLYGLSFVAFLIIFVINIRNVLKNNFVYLLGIIVSFLLYCFMYYQMDNSSSSFNYSLSSMVLASFKRGMFPFIGLICFYMASSTTINKLVNKLMLPSKK
jgi:hypothetical protein